ncbi:Oidioi.mRNA.OKI2018_I69.chr2.g4387.t1.cds [Oikopleura dioica]|uniref:Oidioi.mRNA.OKI2018_I69.chr2.g4387.t1.cds n=1 Tax=Oikopleura dioica TaxID=34765 RepID=A0ABN7T2N3_OIKDI|nr:Oidioi.mRNA.OKI2018_I69.chr2.g4387.t1.cds [Oikopleura dioica]
MATSKFFGCRQLEFTLAIAISVLNAVVFALAFANHYTFDNGNGKTWTWELTGAIATFGTSGFWMPLEFRPSQCRRFWSTVRPLQLIAFCFSHVGVMSFMLMNGATTGWPSKHVDMLIAMDVLASISGFLAFWLGLSMNYRGDE